MATKTHARARKSTATKTPKRPPARTDGAAWLWPCLVADTTTATDPTVANLDALSMGYGTALPVWRPGAGVPQVVITAWSRWVPYIGTVNASVQLTEVG
ncbi:hypothetical protein [Phytomonospora endophytica]|uniref:Uncharacterized protein n=1 Tax=Phytomonospora endophytica TaxID=714109 RepID=A0A841FY29_9ACTN|nr:hypothetical protein [Phytomonospora endophytica]MBB6036870.1 hypothetical protein [Phytomonospora endophytica]GIG68096.1 hypothetical protein Pen01_43910 [Phytomonospora endophytica]